MLIVRRLPDASSTLNDQHRITRWPALMLGSKVQERVQANASNLLELFAPIGAASSSG
jgi:hypothetical protein